MKRDLSIILLMAFIIMSGAVLFKNYAKAPAFSIPAGENTGTTTESGLGASSNCYIGGCSSQICSDKPDAISTCEYRQAYACYRTAKCERQPNGQCGWTETSTLKMCLQNAR